MKGVIHPFTKALYEQDGNGHILVTLDGKTGLFTTRGRHLEGEIKECDPQLCGWVGGPQVVNHRVNVEPTS